MFQTSARRCAIYHPQVGPKEGLEQDFNSAGTRSVRRAIIKSQAGEGWRLVKTAYDYDDPSGAGHTSCRNWDNRARQLEYWRSHLGPQPPTEKHYNEDNEDDSANPDSARGSEGVVAAATTKQQK
jgi:hypothetical protein